MKENIRMINRMGKVKKYSKMDYFFIFAYKDNNFFLMVIDMKVNGRSTWEMVLVREKFF